jgi:hypothetical protein
MSRFNTRGMVVRCCRWSGADCDLTCPADLPCFGLRGSGSTCVEPLVATRASVRRAMVCGAGGSVDRITRGGVRPSRVRQGAWIGHVAGQ